MIELTGVAHFSIPVSDVDKSAKFYTEVVGCGVHHAFMVDASQYQAAKDALRSKGVDIFFEEDRRNGTIDGPRFYFRDPDGTPLEIINRTHYSGQTK